MPTVPTKSFQTSPVAWQDVNTNTQVISSTVNVATVWSASFGISIGRRSGTAFTAGGPTIRIEASKKSSPDNASWIPLFTYQPALGSTIANTTLNGAVSANAANFVVASASNIAVGDILFLGDSNSSNGANAEIVRVKTVSGTTITPEANVVFAHATGSVVTDQAEMTFPALDLREYGSIRTIVDNMIGAQNLAAEVTMTTFDSF